MAWMLNIHVLCKKRKLSFTEESPICCGIGFPGLVNSSLGAKLYSKWYGLLCAFEIYLKFKFVVYIKSTWAGIHCQYLWFLVIRMTKVFIENKKKTYWANSHSAIASNGFGIQCLVLRAFCRSSKKSRIGLRVLYTSSIPLIMKLMSGQLRAMFVICSIVSQPDPTTPRATTNWKDVCLMIYFVVKI